ncbi:phage tail tube protein [Blastomonas natatoria]|uniref:Phage tail tube protein n=1 Tax=Blastomonas natatoria TaxID=34015 RepID=A0A2V3V2I2_9SPHN|nr:phage tail tube protein [Blastomonas natatoria]PXW75982.1 phage tail tube protein [Blastomonas natatoria]
MSVPNESDFALIKVGNGASPEVFAAICGIENVSINRVANTTDRNRRDCAKPGAPGVRRSKTTSKQMDITGTGGVDKADIDAFDDALGVVKNYKVELYKYDGTDTGALMGTFAGAFNLTSANMSLDANGDSSGEITLASDGAWTWTAAA